VWGLVSRLRLYQNRFSIECCVRIGEDNVEARIGFACLLSYYLNVWIGRRNTNHFHGLVEVAAHDQRLLKSFVFRQRRWNRDLARIVSNRLCFWPEVRVV